jgi:hypothetical protein
MKRSSLKLLLVSLSLLGTTAACKKDPGPAESVTFATVCDAKYDPTMEQGLDKTKRVAIEGYLDIPRGLFTMCSDTCNLQLLEKPGVQDKSFRINLKVGDSENQMEKLPEKYSEKDLKVHTHDDKVVGVGARVRVTGGRLGKAADKTCQLVDVDKVEAL